VDGYINDDDDGGTNSTPAMENGNGINEPSLSCHVSSPAESASLLDKVNVLPAIWASVDLSGDE
jgi:hypothetical protein